MHAHISWMHTSDELVSHSTRIHIHTNTHTHTHTYTNTHKHIHTHTQSTHTYINTTQITYTHTAHTPTHINTTQIYIHTYIHTRIHTQTINHAGYSGGAGVLCLMMPWNDRVKQYRLNQMLQQISSENKRSSYQVCLQMHMYMCAYYDPEKWKRPYIHALIRTYIIQREAEKSKKG
jgi:hypothetical protein